MARVERDVPHLSKVLDPGLLQDNPGPFILQGERLTSHNPL